MTLLEDVATVEPGMLPEPYYVDGQRPVELYRADCREVLPLIDPKKIALLLTDPPYGVRENTKRGKAGRGKWVPAGDFPPVAGDDAPFDPSHLLRFPRIVLWGANHYADKLPPSPSWIVWDKLDGLEGRRAVGFNDQADCEMAWTNLGGPARLYRHRQVGALRGYERRKRRVHGTQKPVPLFEWILLHWTPEGGLILDPYMGSGPLAEACKLLDRAYIGFEIETAHLDSAVERLRQHVLDLSAVPTQEEIAGIAERIVALPIV